MLPACLLVPAHTHHNLKKDVVTNVCSLVHVIDRYQLLCVMIFIAHSHGTNTCTNIPTLGQKSEQILFSNIQESGDGDAAHW